MGQLDVLVDGEPDTEKLVKSVKDAGYDAAPADDKK